jgi:RNA polymerase sigma-70 factor (ECF subfamily)
MPSNTLAVVRPIAADDTEPADSFTWALTSIRPDLFRRALMFAGNRDAANDLVQEAMLRALRGRHRFRRGTNIRAWAMSILHNIFIDGCRHESHLEHRDPQPAWTPPEEQGGPLDLLSMKDIEAALDELSPASRQVFRLAYFDDVPYRTISSLTGIPMNTVGSRLHRARRQLRRTLGHVYLERLAQSPAARQW